MPTSLVSVFEEDFLRLQFKWMGSEEEFKEVVSDILGWAIELHCKGSTLRYSARQKSSQDY